LAVRRPDRVLQLVVDHDLENRLVVIPHGENCSRRP
jgi:hypothetical protein